MKCPACGHENREGARFCENCAAPLKQVCGSCGKELRPAAKFCDGCATPVSGPPKSITPEREPRDYTPRHLAEKILTSRSALEGERKQVTVLFADVQGSVALSESVDPETLHKIMDRFFAILADGVHRFEGTVNQYTGDGIMALFGAPIAHEDHARRACYAALHLRDELRRYADELRLNQGLNFSVRMGLNSGEVVVGKIGDDLRMDYTAQGATVGLAARMEQIAEARSIYLTEHTAQLVEGFVRLRDLGLLAVKGVQDPLRVYELQGIGALRTRLDLSRVRGFSKFVGRANETDALAVALDRAVQGNGQVVGVVGEAGVGKSRLCYEFVQLCRARGLTVTEAHGVAHGKTIPFLVVLEYLRGYFGTSEQDTEQSAREKVAGKLLLLDPKLGETLPLLFDFLGVPDPERPVPRMDPDARQRQLFVAMKRITHAQGRREPTVSVIEDLQWIDAGSEAFLENHVEALAETRQLLVVNFRPEYHASWMQRSYYQQLPLLPLGPKAISELLSELLGTDPSLAGLGERIRERTGGNPFFIEEVVQSLIEAGSFEGSSGAYCLSAPIDQVTIPARVQSVLAARIDRLGETEKRALQTASVIGRTFSEPILKAVADLPESELAASLSSLQRAEFIYEEALYPEAVYVFKHALTQEVAYQSQLTERRTRVHGATARAIKELHSDRLNEQAALIAHHFEQGDEALEAAQWHHRAAEWAGASHPEEAISHWRRASTLLANTPESPDTLRLGAVACVRILMQGWRTGLSVEETARLFGEGKIHATRCGDTRLLNLLHLGYGAVNGMAAGAPEIYAHHVGEAVRLAEEAEDEELRFVLQGPLAYSRYLLGDVREALRVVEQASEPVPGTARIGAEVVGFDFRVTRHWFKATFLTAMGKVKEAEDAIDQSFKAARMHADEQALVWTFWEQVQCARVRGDGYEEAGRAAAQAMDTSERTGDVELVHGLYALGAADILNEQWQPATESLKRALAFARERRHGLHYEGVLLEQLSTAQLGLGDIKGARQSADEAVAVTLRQGNRVFECAAHLARARVFLRADGVAAGADIRADLSRALDLVEETGARSHEPFIHEELANLARLTGDDATCQRELREAHRLFTEMGATGHAERLAKELGL